MDAYTPYVVGAYALVFATIAGCVVWVVADRIAARRSFDKAERAAGRVGRAADAAGAGANRAS